MSYQISRLLFSFFVVSLLFVGQAQADMADISRIFHSQSNIDGFEVCFGGGCAGFKQASLNAAEMQNISLIFDEPSQNAQQERMKIAEAIGLLESIVGTKIGTSDDLAGTFDNSDVKGQLDCNDEAINSTTYMRLLKQNGLIVFHEIEDIRTRNFFFTGWPHTTAVIRDNQTGERYAVDSWFYDNGHVATIVPFAMWKSGYQPADSPIGKARAIKIAAPK